MNRQCANGRVRDRTNQPAHEWMRARVAGYVKKPPNQPLYQYRQPNANRQWVEQRQKTKQARAAFPFFLKLALCIAFSVTNARYLTWSCMCTRARECA